MSDVITVRGFVATEVRRFTTDAGVCIASFELGSVERKQDKATNEWVDGDTNWYHVSTFRQLAQNTAFSVNKGQRVIVTGRLKLRQWIKDDGKTGTSADLDADTLGHDLFWGTAVFQRSTAPRKEAAAPAEDDGGLKEGGGPGQDGGSGSATDSTDEQGTGALDVPDDVSALDGVGLVNESTGEVLAADPPY
ncbi:single-stranded DNA-binding protein [Paenarthrobacter sp. PH39-S1]|uniref:single-stranded DNA-binding protein n=1 Tax=Micrococcaceae TaxID=1268 RepID=UPI0024B9F353|nr:single-stranded DNA-binding protein [Paenarthrobacter sp. PH39-S1]MDJ0357013.1 single-stranded DNA-binding protein [Paenarthrobacter sp. PH39-S1]